MYIPEKSPDKMCGMLTAFSVLFLALAIVLAIGGLSPFLQMRTTNDDLISKVGPLHTSSKNMHAAIVTCTNI